ncbi:MULTISPECIES: MerR family transcriptional regulator [unclassified Microbacterium]|uniref:MerR family transcriptional regulator n=1 Tax=unclassified Microbacterium TaxID=2609290 RepID=UPI0012F988B5|nr:MerR family transcriptional regulator [Microbacterium sp. MAH-37]MVQ43883.1 MerR family transcriptional regulator [Microbacterium sp. MAH-37]
MTEPRVAEQTVGELAHELGITVRTLHHWDEIGLASPSGRSAAGYRLYTGADADRVRRVVAYRETGLGLDAIRAVLNDEGAEIVATLREQRAQLAQRIEELLQLDDRLAAMAEAHERGIPLAPAEQRAIIGDDWDPDAAQSAQERWGGTLQWAQFAERAATRSRAEWQELSAAMSRLQLDLGNALARGVQPGDDEADALVDRHRETFSNFFPLTREMQVCLGRMFEQDAGFAAHYDGFGEGLSHWFRRIIDASARKHGIDPDTATWR